MPTNWNDDHSRTPDEPTDPSTAPPNHRTIDQEVTRLLNALGIKQCESATSAALAAAARSATAEAFEAMLTTLEEIHPIWNDLVAQRKTRYTGTLLDELVWWIKHRRVRRGTPDQIGPHMGIVSVLELAAELVKRLRQEPADRNGS